MNFNEDRLIEKTDVPLLRLKLDYPWHDHHRPLVTSFKKRVVEYSRTIDIKIVNTINI